MTDQSDQNTSDNLATGEAGADQEAWQGADIDTEQLISSDQTSSGSAPSSAPNEGAAATAPTTDGSEPSDEEATEEAVAVPEPSTELDEPLTDGAAADDVLSGDDADGSTDHQPSSGPAAEATDDARGIYDTAPD